MELHHKACVGNRFVGLANLRRFAPYGGNDRPVTADFAEQIDCLLKTRDSMLLLCIALQMTSAQICCCLIHLSSRFASRRWRGNGVFE